MTQIMKLCKDIIQTGLVSNVVVFICHLQEASLSRQKKRLNNLINVASFELAIIIQENIYFQVSIIMSINVFAI